VPKAATPPIVAPINAAQNVYGTARDADRSNSVNFPALPAAAPAAPRGADPADWLRSAAAPGGRPRPAIGAVHATRGVLAWADRSALATFVLAAAWAAFTTGDFGDLDAGDSASNAAAMSSGARILASYGLPNLAPGCGDGCCRRIWICADPAPPGAPRVTTCLWPCEY